MKPVVALIVPMYDPSLKPDNTLPGRGSAGGEHPWLPEGTLPHPEHPIYYPLPPGAPVDPSYGIPVRPGEEGGAPHPDQGLPGAQPRPDHDLPAFPSHPIVLPPGNGGWLPVYIDNTLPGRGSAGGEHPDNTLPVPPPTEEQKASVEWKCAWTPTTGWVSFAVIVPAAGTPVPTPSKAKSK
jgi:hypothetical protein